jgi:hypothetical protein
LEDCTNDQNGTADENTSSATQFVADIHGHECSDNAADIVCCHDLALDRSPREAEGPQKGFVVYEAAKNTLVIAEEKKPSTASSSNSILKRLSLGALQEQLKNV